MIIPAFLVASMVGFHVEFSQSMYSSKWPYSIPISCTRVTGPSVYWRTSWACAFSESEEAARHMDKIMVLIIFFSPLVMNLYSASEILDCLYLPVLTENRQFNKFIILTMMLLCSHDSAIGWEEVLGVL